MPNKLEAVRVQPKTLTLAAGILDRNKAGLEDEIASRDFAPEANEGKKYLVGLFLLVRVLPLQKLE